MSKITSEEEKRILVVHQERGFIPGGEVLDMTLMGSVGFLCTTDSTCQTMVMLCFGKFVFEETTFAQVLECP